MSVWNDGASLRQVVLGATAVKGPLTNPQAASSDIFAVTGGLVLVTAIVGIVTTVQGATANSFNLTYTKASGSAVDLCAATVCTSDAAGSLYSITGVAADLLSAQKVTGTAIPTVTFANVFAGAKGIVLPIGTMQLKASGSNTGATKWYCTYIPLDDGAVLAAA